MYRLLPHSRTVTEIFKAQIFRQISLIRRIRDKLIDRVCLFGAALYIGRYGIIRTLDMFKAFFIAGNDADIPVTPVGSFFNG